MKLDKPIYIVCALATAGSLTAYMSPPKVTLINGGAQQSQGLIPQEMLVEALSVIGVSLSDITDMQSSGKPNANVVSLYTAYANNSDKTMYNALSQDEGNALILFGFKLKSAGLISDKTLNNLMVAEKKRLGLSTVDIQTLTALTLSMQENPSYAVTAADVSFVRQMLPFIEENPFAFADVLGLLIRAFLVQEDSDSPIDPTLDNDIETALAAAAQTLTGLTDDQITNITNVTQNYETTQNFDDTTENVSDLNAAMAVTAIPFGVFALYPLIGSENVYTVDNITRNYEGSFNRDDVNRYNGAVNRNRQDLPRNGTAARAGAANRTPADRGANVGDRNAGQNRGRAQSLDRSRNPSGNRAGQGGARASQGRGDAGSRAGGGGGVRGGGGGRGGGGSRGGGGGRR